LGWLLAWRCNFIHISETWMSFVIVIFGYRFLLVPRGFTSVSWHACKRIWFLFSGRWYSCPWQSVTCCWFMNNQSLVCFVYVWFDYGSFSFYPNVIQVTYFGPVVTDRVGENTAISIKCGTWDRAAHIIKHLQPLFTIFVPTRRIKTWIVVLCASFQSLSLHGILWVIKKLGIFMRKFSIFILTWPFMSYKNTCNYCQVFLLLTNNRNKIGLNSKNLNVFACMIS
jgi:hypothetical protein